MEVYEMPITVEESRNYHKLLYQLKALNLVEWIKTYRFTVIFNMIFAFVIFTFSFMYKFFCFFCYIYIFNKFSIIYLE